jgi:hypothetical protein
VSLQPFLTINIEINESLQPTDDQIIPFDINNVPSFLFCVSWQEDFLDIFKKREIKSNAVGLALFIGRGNFPEDAVPSLIRAIKCSDFLAIERAAKLRL